MTSCVIKCLLGVSSVFKCAKAFSLSGKSSVLPLSHIKLNQDPVKALRLKELGWKPKILKVADLSKEQILERLEKLETAQADHEKRIKVCEVRR